MTQIQSRQEIVATFADELTRFADLVRPLDAGQLNQLSRCSGWTVGDVAAHVTGTIADVVAGRIEGQGTPAVTHRQVKERFGWSGGQLADELTTNAPQLLALLQATDDAAWDAPLGGSFDGSLGWAIEALLFDTVVHADDIATATGVAYAWTLPGTTAAVSHVKQHLDDKGWGPALLALDGLPEVGEGGRIKGDPRDFVLTATGRLDPSVLDLDDAVNIYA